MTADRAILSASRERGEHTLWQQGRQRVPDVALGVQDLRFSLLIQHGGEAGVPHLCSLGPGRIRRLAERQLEIYHSVAMLLPMSRWLADDIVAGGVVPGRVTVVNQRRRQHYSWNRAARQGVAAADTVVA